jgi:Integrase zinc binding domain
MLAEVHEGICGSHQGAKMLAKRIIRAGFYWPTLKFDAATLVHKCKKCQFNSKISRIPPYEMIFISDAWPFDLWGIDILGPFPTAVRQRKYILVATEYFTKWVETEALTYISSKISFGVISSAGSDYHML